jgi:two-component system CheB/CheR fusion protein
LQSHENPGSSSNDNVTEDEPRLDQDCIPVVGIGASAGGLEAVMQLLRTLPGNTGMAFVFVQHLDPSHESKLAEILGRAASIPVREIQDRMPVEANAVYVIPPNTSLKISAGILTIEPRKDAPSPHFPIDCFLRSLADDVGNNGIAVILSGTGSDGAEGLKAVKAACGITFAQTENTAKYTGMPLNAIATGAVDFILPPHEIAAELARIGQHPSAFPRTLDGTAAVGEDSALKRIFSLLRTATKVDFKEYKQSTIKRRIARRMVVHKIDTLADYAQHLEAHSNEVNELYRDILIHVTSFFREAGSFDVLMQHVGAQLKERQHDETFRVWAAGCASGEEVYSIAICLDELLAGAGRRTHLQFFGTDISEKALQRARKAVYPEAITTDVTPERVRRYFVKVDSGYQIIKSIREACVFARHDLTCDPPFSRLDLIICRNVLIYMGPALQKRILPMFHYGLKPSGVLMLGSAEAVSSTSDLFVLVNNEYKIYQKNPIPARFSVDLVPDRTSTVAPAAAWRAADLQTLVNQAIQNKYAVGGVVIKRDMQIVAFQGHTGSYLDPAPGAANLNLLRMVREELAFKVQALVFSAIDQNNPVKELGIRIAHGKVARQVNVEVIPLASQTDIDPYLLVLFEEAPEVEGAESSGAVTAGLPAEKALDYDAVRQRVEELELELSEARVHLRSMAEEHEASVEELRASNEEVRSSNEELQSTNEELGTTKEELQSVNEELTTINEELRTKNADLAAVSDDLKNLFSAVNLPILMIGNDLRIRRFTPAAESLLNVISADIGRLVTDLRGTVEVPHLLDMLHQAIDQLAVTQVEIHSANKRWYSISCRPYRTTDNRIEGAVITFVDIDALKLSLEDASRAREYAEAIVNTIWEPLIVLNGELRVQRAAPGFYRAFQVSPAETEGKLFYELGNGQWDIPKLRVLLENILPSNSTFQNFQVEQSFPHVGRRNMLLNARRIRRDHDGTELILLAIDDITDRQQAAEVHYRRLFETSTDGILLLGTERREIIDVNPHFLELCVCPRAELIGKHLWEIGLFDLTEQLREMMADLRLKEIVRLENIQIKARDGKRIDAELVANRYSVGGEEIIQCNIRDVTERRRAENDLRRSNEDLQQFAYAASHDLQEPLRTVRNYTQLIVAKYEPLLDEEGRSFLTYTQSAAERMSDLIKALLAYSQVNVPNIRPEPVKAEAVLAATVMNLQMAIADYHAIVTNDPLPTVRIDQMQFVQLLQNLIGNALKYRRPDEPPHIHVAAQHDHGEWVFSVQDNGIGFESRHADRVFGVFKRLHGKEYPGTGIGLAICKKIVERHGGRIWTNSSPGEGSTFYFTIPDSQAQA